MLIYRNASGNPFPGPASPAPSKLLTGSGLDQGVTSTLSFLGFWVGPWILLDRQQPLAFHWISVHRIPALAVDFLWKAGLSGQADSDSRESCRVERPAGRRGRAHSTKRQERRLRLSPCARPWLFHPRW